MSEAAVQAFFPFSSRVVQTLSPPLWEHTFPPDSAKLCPVPVWSDFVGAIDIRWPLLGAACLFGAVYGYYASAEMLRGPRDTDGGQGQCGPGGYAWGMAFRYYACMSACGLLYHCLLEEGSLACGLAYAGDMAFTAASCLSIATGALVDMGCLSDDPFSPPYREGKVTRACHSALICLLFLIALSAHLLGWDAVPDQLYVQGWWWRPGWRGTPAVAAPLASGTNAKSGPSLAAAPSSQLPLLGNVAQCLGLVITAHRFLILSGACVAMGVLLGAEMDRHACAWFHSAHASFITIGFWACNVGMVALHAYYHAAKEYRKEREATRVLASLKARPLASRATHED